MQQACSLALRASSILSVRRCPRFRVKVNVRFSIAAGVKGDLLTSRAFLHFMDLRGLMSPHGLLLLFEVGARPPHDGVRRMERFNLLGALAAQDGRACGHYELTPPIVPVRTSSCRGRTG